MRTLYNYLVIYWTQKVHNYFIFLCSLHCIPYKCMCSKITPRSSQKRVSIISGVTTRCAWPGRGESVTELMPFMNFLVHPYTCCSDRRASPYWTFIRRWIYMGFTPSLLKNGWQNAVLLWLHVASGAAIFTLLLRHRVAFLHRTATCRPLFKQWVLLLSNYKSIELCLEFLSDFSGFHLTLPRLFKRIYSLHYFKKHKVRCEASILCVCVPPFKFRTVYRCSWNLVWPLYEWDPSSTSHVFLP